MDHSLFIEFSLLVVAACLFHATIRWTTRLQWIALFFEAAILRRAYDLSPQRPVELPRFGWGAPELWLVPAAVIATCTRICARAGWGSVKGTSLFTFVNRYFLRFITRVATPFERAALSARVAKHVTRWMCAAGFVAASFVACVTRAPDAAVVAACVALIYVTGCVAFTPTSVAPRAAAVILIAVVPYSSVFLLTFLFFHANTVADWLESVAFSAHVPGVGGVLSLFMRSGIEREKLFFDAHGIEHQAGLLAPPPAMLAGATGVTRAARFQSWFRTAAAMVISPPPVMPTSILPSFPGMAPYYSYVASFWVKTKMGLAPTGAVTIEKPTPALLTKLRGAGYSCPSDARSACCGVSADTLRLAMHNNAPTPDEAELSARIMKRMIAYMASHPDEAYSLAMVALADEWVNLRETTYFCATTVPGPRLPSNIYASEKCLSIVFGPEFSFAASEDFGYNFCDWVEWFLCTSVPHAGPALAAYYRALRAQFGEDKFRFFGNLGITFLLSKYAIDEASLFKLRQVTRVRPFPLLEDAMLAALLSTPTRADCFIVGFGLLNSRTGPLSQVRMSEVLASKRIIATTIPTLPASPSYYDWCCVALGAWWYLSSTEPEHETLLMEANTRTQLRNASHAFGSLCKKNKVFYATDKDVSGGGIPDDGVRFAGGARDGFLCYRLSVQANRLGLPGLSAADHIMLSSSSYTNTELRAAASALRKAQYQARCEDILARVKGLGAQYSEALSNAAHQVPPPVIKVDDAAIVRHACSAFTQPAGDASLRHARALVGSSMRGLAKKEFSITDNVFHGPTGDFIDVATLAKKLTSTSSYSIHDLADAVSAGGIVRFVSGSASAQRADLVDGLRLGTSLSQDQAEAVVDSLLRGDNNPLVTLSVGIRKQQERDAANPPSAKRVAFSGSSGGVGSGKAKTARTTSPGMPANSPAARFIRGKNIDLGDHAIDEDEEDDYAAEDRNRQREEQQDLVWGSVYEAAVGREVVIVLPVGDDESPHVVLCSGHVRPEDEEAHVSHEAFVAGVHVAPLKHAEACYLASSKYGQAVCVRTTSGWVFPLDLVYPAKSLLVGKVLPSEKAATITVTRGGVASVSVSLEECHESRSNYRSAVFGAVLVPTRATPTHVRGTVVMADKLTTGLLPTLLVRPTVGANTFSVALTVANPTSGNNRFFAHNANTNAGDCGSALFDANGKLVGIHVGANTALNHNLAYQWGGDFKQCVFNDELARSAKVTTAARGLVETGNESGGATASAVGSSSPSAPKP